MLSISLEIHAQGSLLLLTYHFDQSCEASELAYAGSQVPLLKTGRRTVTKMWTSVHKKESWMWDKETTDVR